MIGYDWDGGHPLSVIADDHNCVINDRVPHCLLRPIYVNAVEVGYAHLVGEDSSPIHEGRRLSVRGVALALWYFICRGHQAVGILPYCFKKYADKSDNWNALMELYRMNLIEFTPGFGPEKYSEVNRIIAYRARRMGGCMVARSQMHSVVEDHPILDKTVERRLLMPSFNGDDIIFPIDGPLGRSGITFRQTVVCNLTEVDWARVAVGQMILKDQRIWLRRLSVLFPENDRWNIMAHMVSLHQSNVILDDPPEGYPPVDKSVQRIHPPETNPLENPGFSLHRFRRGSQQRARYSPFNVAAPDNNFLSSDINEKDYDPLFFPPYVTKERIEHIKVLDKQAELESMNKRECEEAEFECDCCSPLCELNRQKRREECSDCGLVECACDELNENGSNGSVAGMSDVLEDIMKDKELSRIGGVCSIYQFNRPAAPAPEVESAPEPQNEPEPLPEVSINFDESEHDLPVVEVVSEAEKPKKKGKSKHKVSDEERWRQYRHEFNKHWKKTNPGQKVSSSALFEYLEAKAAKLREEDNPEHAVIEHLCRQQKRRRERRKNEEIPPLLPGEDVTEKLKSIFGRATALQTMWNYPHIQDYRELVKLCREGEALRDRLGLHRVLPLELMVEGISPESVKPKKEVFELLKPATATEERDRFERLTRIED